MQNHEDLMGSLPHSTHDCAEHTRTNVKRFTDFDGALVEQGCCSSCGSHQSTTLIEPTTVEELPGAVRLLSGMNDDFKRRYTVHELLWLLKVYRKAGGLPPDFWTNEQVASALASGEVPKWETQGRGIEHALNVRDCMCSLCSRAKAVAG